MADAVVAFGLQKLSELLIRESNRLKGVHEQANELQNDLRRLKSFVKDEEETNKSRSERVKNCVQEIVYDAEDIIESFLINEERLGREKGIKKHLKRVACFTFAHQEFGSQIRSIITRFSKVIYNVQTANIDAGALVSGFQRLNQLRLGIKIEKLPNELQFPSRIAFVSLSSCDLPEDPMPVLEKLHSLKIVSLELNVFTGKKMVCSKTGFPKLHTLVFSILDNLEEWVVEEESMPCLCHLEINDCRKLKSLPDGLRCVTSLEELRVGWMENEFKDKLIQGGEDYYKIQHVSYVVFYNCGDE